MHVIFEVVGPVVMTLMTISFLFVACITLSNMLLGLLGLAINIGRWLSSSKDWAGLSKKFKGFVGWFGNKE